MSFKSPYPRDIAGRNVSPSKLISRFSISLGWLALVSLGSACTLEPIPLDSFACVNGGPCDSGLPRDGGETPDAGTAPDAGETPDAGPQTDTGVMRDGGVQPDAEPADGGPPDAGPPPPEAACNNIQPIRDDGTATGSLDTAINQNRARCVGVTTGPDQTFGFYTPGKLRSLEIDFAFAQFDTVMSLFHQECEPSGFKSCNDDSGGRESRILAQNLPAGPYGIVVDSFDSDTTSGQFSLRVEGVLEPGEPCNPRQTFLSCWQGDCTETSPGNFTCPNELLDCNDGIDADQDGMIDEDGAACVGTIRANCPISPFGGSAPNPFFESRTLRASVSGGTPVLQEWVITNEPVPGALAIRSNAGPDIRVSPQLPTLPPETYDLMYVARDANNELWACETNMSVPAALAPDFQLIVDLRIRSLNSTSAAGNLHFLDPSATDWFTPTRACSTPFCENWGIPGRPLVNMQYPEFKTAFREFPIDRQNYGIGVSAEKDIEATVRIYCNGELKAERTEQLIQLPNGDRPFWRAAEVQMVPDNTFCQILEPIEALVPESEAQMNR